MSHYKNDDHQKVSKEIQKIKNAKWIVSYDNTPEIKNIHNFYKERIYFSSYCQ